MQHHYTIARKANILELLTRQGGMSNAEIAEAMGLKYRAIQRLTQELESEGRITGRFNTFGAHYSNVTWFVALPKEKMPMETLPMTGDLRGALREIEVRGAGAAAYICFDDGSGVKPSVEEVKTRLKALIEAGVTEVPVR